MKNWLLASLVASACLPLWAYSASSQDVMALIDELSSSKPAGSPATASKSTPSVVITEDMLYRPGRASTGNASAAPAPTSASARLSQDYVGQDVCFDDMKKKSALSFYDIVVLAICNNPKAKSTWLNLYYYQIEKDKSYAGYMPTIDGVSTFGHQETKTHYTATTYDSTTESWSNVLELSWLLFDFGQREAGVDRAKSQLGAVEFMTQSDLQDVVLDAAQKYFAVIAAQAYLDAARDIELIAYKSLQVTQGKREAGVGVLADELQAKNAALSSTNYRIQYEGKVRNAMGALASVIGRDITKNISFQKGLTTPTERELENIQHLIDKALNQHPYLLSVKERIAVSEKALAIAQRGFLPSVYLTSRWGESDAKYGPTYDTDEFYVGLKVNVPIFSGFSQYNAVRSAQNVLEQSKNQYTQSRNDIALQVWQTYQSLSTTQNNLKTMSDLVASSRRAYDVARGRYQSGVGSILELLNTQNDLSQAQTDNVNNIVEWHLSRLQLAASLGQLDVSAVKNSPLN